MSQLRGGPELRAAFAAAAEAVPQRVNRLVSHYGSLMTSRIQARASGRPGPRAQTGDYRRSITLQLTAGPRGSTATIGTNKPQANRLEHGFYGIDSLGRTYHQPPLPHFGPGFDETAPEFIDGAEHLLRTLL